MIDKKEQPVVFAAELYDTTIIDQFELLTLNLIEQIKILKGKIEKNGVRGNFEVSFFNFFPFYAT